MFLHRSIRWQSNSNRITFLEVKLKQLDLRDSLRMASRICSSKHRAFIICNIQHRTYSICNHQDMLFSKCSHRASTRCSMPSFSRLLLSICCILIFNRLLVSLCSIHNFNSLCNTHNFSKLVVSLLNFTGNADKAILFQANLSNNNKMSATLQFGPLLKASATLEAMGRI